MYVALALALLAGIAVFAYSPGLKGVFVFDSVERVVRNESLRMESIAPRQLLGAAYAAEAGYPQRGLAYVSLALNYYLSGERFDPFAFKLTNLAIHLVNGLLVFALAGLILARWCEARTGGARPTSSTGILVMACVAAGVWMLHPIQLTSVLYVIQRMTSLAGTCVLGGAIVYLLARARLEQGRKHALTLMYVGVVGFTTVGFLFKQNAFLLPVFAAVLEVFVFDRRRLAAPDRLKLRVYFGLTLVLPALAAVVVLVAGAELGASSYAFRDFDMVQRLLTQARVLFFYVGLLLVPDIRRFGLYHDDIGVSVGFLEPVTTLLAVVAWIAIATLVVRGARHRAPWAFAIAWFLVGHAVESSILPLEIAHEHRNYVPSIGIWVAFAYYAGALWERAGRLRSLVPAAIAAWLVVLTVVTGLRAEAWRRPAALMDSLARHHPASYRAASGYAFNSVPRDADLGLRFDAFRRAAALSDDAVSPLIEMSKIAVALGLYLDEAVQQSPAAVDASGAPSVLDRALIADNEQNALLLSALDDEIGRRLGSARPRTDNVVALVALVDCSLNGSLECTTLRGNATRWHDSALSNERLSETLRAALELSLAKLHVLAGDDDEAVRHARLAGRAAGDNFTYRLQEATLYALLERWGDLSDALGEIENRFPMRSRADPRYASLRSRLDSGTIQ